MSNCYTKVIDFFYKNKWYFFTCGMTFLYRMLMIAGEYDMRCASDDMGMLAAPAWLAGYDWSEVIANTKYYGVAYSIFFTPIIKWIDNPITIWQLIIYMNLTVVALGSVYGQYLGIKYLKQPNNFITALIAISCSLSIRPSVAMSQEPALYLVTWLIVGVLIKCMQDNISLWEKILYTLLVALYSIYGYLIHTRAIVYFVAIFVSVIIYTLIHKKKISKFLYLIVMLIVAYILSDAMKDGIVTFFWSNQEFVRNVELPITKTTFTSLFSVTGIQVAFDASVSNLLCASVYTYGISTAVLIMLVMVIWSIWAKHRYEMSSEKSVMFLFSAICFLIGIVGVAVIWGKGVVPIYHTDEVNVYYKGFAYYRYYASFLGPAMFVALSEFINKSKQNRKIVLGTVVANLAIIAYWFLFVLEKLSKSEYINSVFKQYVPYECEGLKWVNCWISIATIILVICILAFSKKKQWACAGMIFALIISITSATTNFMSGIFVPTMVMPDAVDMSYRMLCDLEKQGYRINEIYCEDVRKSYYYQFVLKDKKVHIGYPAEDEKMLIFTMDMERPLELTENYQCVFLDKHECVWTDDEALYDEIKQWYYQNYLLNFLSEKMFFEKLNVDEEGFAMYGPYINLEKGKYQVSISMSGIVDNQSSVGYFDIASDFGENIICRQECDGNEEEIILEFELTELTENIEIRYYKYSGNSAVPNDVSVTLMY